MFKEYNPIPKMPDNSKAGITLCLNQNEGDEPFEATVYFKKAGKNEDELRDDNAINLTASGKLRLDIGKNTFIEVFAEKADRLKDAASDDKTDSCEGGSE